MWYVECEGFGAVSYFSLSNNREDSADIHFGDHPIYFDNLYDCVAFCELLDIVYPDNSFEICKSILRKRIYSGNPD